MLRWLAASDQRTSFPVQLDSDGGRMLLADIAGEDLHDAPLAVRQVIAARLHPTQVAAASRVAALLAAGVPDRRFVVLRPSLEVVADDARRASPDLDWLVGGLAERLEPRRSAVCPTPSAMETCTRATSGPPGGPHVIIDWGDSVMGNPAFDILRLIEGCRRGRVDMIGAWARGGGPTCQAVTRSGRQNCCDRSRPCGWPACMPTSWLNIEPSEYPYHFDDPALWLARAERSRQGGGARSRRAPGAGPSCRRRPVRRGHLTQGRPLAHGSVHGLGYPGDPRRTAGGDARRRRRIRRSPRRRAEPVPAHGSGLRRRHHRIARPCRPDGDP